MKSILQKQSEIEKLQEEFKLFSEEKLNIKIPAANTIAIPEKKVTADTPQLS
ncbi:MAG TPA: hypothetical protein VK528_10180 [Flavobacterium sp.]|nr:hypothetical protein [Flavobacterium sp.]